MSENGSRGSNMGNNMGNNMGKYVGQCLCGTVKYEVTKIENKMGHCHCNMCRKFHGAAFATFGEAQSENFNWVSGEENLKSYVGSNGSTRRFCDTCGSSMTFAPANDIGEVVEFSLGTLDTDIELKPDAHIYTDFGASWYDLSDSLPKYSEGRDSEKR